MKMGTKSVLFGAHCFFIHPWFVAAAWWKTYGFPTDPRLWVAFFVHDIGYLGKPNMDGPEGEQHPLIGAQIMRWLFDRDTWFAWLLNQVWGYGTPGKRFWSWGDFVYYHSRYLAKQNFRPFSLLCVVDKLAITYEPYWFYIPRVWLSGELREYIGQTEQHHPDMALKNDTSARVWHSKMTTYCRNWAMEHKDGRQDEWTQNRTRQGT